MWKNPCISKKVTLGASLVLGILKIKLHSLYNVSATNNWFKSLTGTIKRIQGRTEDSNFETKAIVNPSYAINTTNQPIIYPSPNQWTLRHPTMINVSAKSVILSVSL